MTPNRDATPRGVKRKLAGVLAIVALLVLTLVLSGCVMSVGTPRFTELAVGIAQAQQGATALSAEQILDEYGLFYSTDRNDVVNIDELGRDGTVGAVIITNPDVRQIRVLLTHTIAASEAGTFTVNVRTVPGTTYYYRFYSIGRDADGAVRRTLYTVAEHVTSNPTLKSLKRSRGTLSPAFSKTKYTYTNTISRYTSSSKITVVPTVSGSKVQMTLGDPEFGPWTTARTKTVSVSRGHQKQLSIRVTPPGGISATYTVTVRRKS
jgi:hypothetical protein